MTKIEWTEETWNPVVGCSVVSPGCTNCYAMRMAGTRLKNMPLYKGLTQPSKAGPVWTGELRLNEKALTQPLRWKKPRTIFVNSMSDLFHEDMPDEWIDKVFTVMALTGRHKYQILTKRPERMRVQIERLGQSTLEAVANDMGYSFNWEGFSLLAWPLHNVWLGTSIENNKAGEARAWHLCEVPAARHFWSLEPLLEDLGNLTTLGLGDTIGDSRPAVDWVIVGGETGPGARPMDPNWARSIRDQCAAFGVPFFMKQMANKAPIPDDLMIREYPG